MAILEEYATPNKQVKSQSKQTNRQAKRPKLPRLPKTYTVKRKENWASIAGKLYGDQSRMRDLALENKEVDQLKTGMRIRIPQLKSMPKAEGFALPTQQSNMRGRAGLETRVFDTGQPPPPTPGGSLFGPPSPDQLNVPMGALTNLPQPYNQFNQAQSQMANAIPKGFDKPGNIPGVTSTINLPQTPFGPPAPQAPVTGPAPSVGTFAGVNSLPAPGYIGGSDRTSIVGYLLESGIAPLEIFATDVAQYGFTPQELTEAGYQLGEYGNWYRLPGTPVEQTSTGGGGAKAPAKSGRRGYGGGGTSYPAFGRAPSLTGRDLYTVSLGLINWRI
jgi:hypothetical protein